MKNRLILTLTTTRGSRQYSLNKVAKYVALLAVLLVLSGAVLSNVLLLKTSNELTVLEQVHQSLTDRFDDVVGSRELYRTELDHLAESLQRVALERDSLQQRTEQDGEKHELWVESLLSLERELGMNVSSEMTLARATELQKVTDERLFMLRGVPNGKPIIDGEITDRYGMRNHPVTGERKKHDGLDFRAAVGTPVYATADGAVEYSGYHKSSGYGNLLIVAHNFGFKSYFGHMKKLLVRSGSVVRKGQLIGYSGNTGLSTGPHLHYEVRYLFKSLDPRPFVNWGMDNYENLFTEVKGIAWDSLREMHPRNHLAQPSLSSQKVTSLPAK